ncbi:MAG: hypothetical protein IT395_05070 [Candidatus Omnitrophica bacterium]|nr:hypothetical protein [Candidatus Omnitrophota bacterium]
MKKNFDPFWLVGGLTIIAWVFCFRVFLTREAPLISDAVSFYDHLKFYIDNISRGIYPLWDPLWSCGSPNEFFLRRIGPFNPFLLLIIIPYKLGLPYWAAFASFITFYFFLGMAGFYKLALEVLKDKRSALLAFVLLSFSSLGTRVFDSYIMMFMTPAIWFFYFLFVFDRTFQKYALGGMVFCTMLLMTTYIPFYFIVIVLTFGLFFVPVFPRESKSFVFGLMEFGRRNPFFFLLCVAAVAASCVPGLMFFKQAGQGTFAMPLRHFDAAAQNVLSVKSDVTTYWAIPEDLLFSLFYLEDLRLFNFAVFYVPLLCIIFWLMSLATPLNRKLVFMFMWAFFLFLMGSPYLVPLYDFLNQHIFFFKYFRNLHFFLWLVILPLFILFVVAQLKDFLGIVSMPAQRKKWIVCFIVLVHIVLAGFLVWRDSFNYSTWAVLALSFVTFVLLLWGRLSVGFFYGFCFIVAAIEPMEAYQNLNNNVEKYLALSVYDQFSPEFQYTRGQKTILLVNEKDLTHETNARNNPLYFGTQWYNMLWDNVDFAVLKNYTFAKFVLYDRIESFDEEKQDLRTVERSWQSKLNVAYIAPGQIDTSLAGLVRPVGPDSPSPMAIEKDSEQFRVVRSDANMVKIRTNFSAEKFLVFNDGYYPGWHAYLNDKPVTLYRANVAFKGVVLPPGQQFVEFRFGQPWRYGVEVALLTFYGAFFSSVIWLWRKERNA